MSNQGSPSTKIIFEVGTKIEAQDFTQNWYPAKICRVEALERKALIHFEGWNHRFDEWISFDSERIRANSRSVEPKEPDKIEKIIQKDVCDYKEWKVDDRVLAKWMDGKFYPAKVMKKNDDGMFEVLFYDGIQKTLQRTNLKPDNRKIQALPVSKDRLKEQSKRMQRKTKLANARAERAQKRSKELGSSVIKKRERKRSKQDSESGTPRESNVSSPVSDSVSLDDDIRNISGTSSYTAEDSEPKSLDTSTEDTEDNKDNYEYKAELEKSVLSNEAKLKGTTTEELGVSPSSPKKGTTQADGANKSDAAVRQADGANKSEAAVRQADGANKSEAAVRQADETSKSEAAVRQADGASKSKAAVRQADEASKSKAAVRLADGANKSEAAVSLADGASKSEATVRLADGASKSKAAVRLADGANKSEAAVRLADGANKSEAAIRLADAASKSEAAVTEGIGKGDDSSTTAKTDQETKKCDEENCKDTDKTEEHKELKQPEKQDSSSSSINLQSPTVEKKSDSLKEDEGSSPLIEVVSVEASEIKVKDIDDTVDQEKTLDSLKDAAIKLSQKAEQALESSNSGQTKLTPSFHGDFKPTDNKPKKSSKISPKTHTKQKGRTAQSQPGERKRATRSRSTISPRGYGYSMAVMHPQVPKPEEVIPAADATPAAIDNIIESLSQESSAVMEINQLDVLESKKELTKETTGTKGKTKNFEAKKFRLDQITGKLSAQRQKDAEAAVQSPSAFQMTVKKSPSPPLMATSSPQPASLPTPPPPKAPSPSAPLGSHYPMDANYNVPPPLIYAPQCNNPHCQQHYPTPPRAQIHTGMSHRMHLAPSHLHPHSGGFVMYPPGVGPTYDTRPPMKCSCANCTAPVYHLQQDTTPHHESALARLMQVEQRILHAGPTPHMPHYMEAPPHHGSWLPHGHGLPHTPQYCPLPAKHEEMWRPERTPLKPKSPSHISPSAESEASKIIQRWKTDRPAPLKLSPHDNKTNELHNTNKHPDLNEPQHMDPKPSDIKDEPSKIIKDEPSGVDPEKAKQAQASPRKPIETPLTSPIITSTSAATTALNSQSTSFGGRPRKGKEHAPHAPKELIIDLDHNKFKCPIKGCDKSFRKESGLDYHMKYYHSPGGREVKRKRSSGINDEASMRSDGTPETSPDIVGPIVTKRRCHRSSAPGQLSTEQIPAELLASLMEPENTSLESLSGKEDGPSTSQDIELEIEPGTETESRFFGSVESMEVEEVVDTRDGDVIRCRCLQMDEGGFMIQCEQCLTWQHSECVGLTEQTVPSRYLCYVCSNPKGLRRRAKYKNDFDWFRKGSLSKFSFSKVDKDNAQYDNQVSLSTHDLVSDLHGASHVLKSLRLKLDILGSPNHPALSMWYKPPQKEQLSILPPQPPDNSKYNTSLLMVKTDPFSNGVDDSKPSLTDHNQNGIENTFSDGSGGLVNGEVTPATSSRKDNPPCTQEHTLNVSINLTLDGKGEGGSDNDVVSPLPPLVPVGSTVGSESSNVKAAANVNSSKANNKGLNNNTETPGQSIGKDPCTVDVVMDEQSTDRQIPRLPSVMKDNPNNEEDSVVSMETKGRVAMVNLLDDVSELQESLDTRLDVIERQIEVLEQKKHTSNGGDSKPDLRKLVKDLNRIKRLALHVG